jgi:hypothetical protein
VPLRPLSVAPSIVPPTPSSAAPALLLPWLLESPLSVPLKM